MAAGIRATSSGALNWPDVVTNGDTWADSGSGSSGEFAYTAQTGLQYVQLDLGAVYSVDKVRVWHYAADGRIYNATKTQVSADGSTWYTVFDSAVSGTYAETAEGRTYTFTSRNVRYMRDYLKGSNKNAGNHWVELEVWGTRTTVYVGAHYEKNVTANTTTSYYYAGGQRVAMRKGGVVYYLHADHLGSASVTTDASGAKVGELRYYPYGGTRYTSGATPTSRRFTGQIEDATIGLYFYNARYYDPALGRFVQADSIVPSPGDPQSLNRYGYCGGNPLKFTDPSGYFDVPMDDNGNLIEECGELCQLLGFQDFATFADWWNGSSPDWQKILIDADWGDMLSFTWDPRDNEGDPWQFNLIFAARFGTRELVFWDSDRGKSWDFSAGEMFWNLAYHDVTGRSDTGEMIPFGSQRHPWKGQGLIWGDGEHVTFDDAYRRGQTRAGAAGVGSFLTVAGLVASVPPAVKIGWMIISNAMVVSAVIGDSPAPRNDIPYVHGGSAYDRYAIEAFVNVMNGSH